MKLLFFLFVCFTPPALIKLPLYTVNTNQHCIPFQIKSPSAFQWIESPHFLARLLLWNICRTMLWKIHHFQAFNPLLKCGVHHHYWSCNYFAIISFYFTCGTQIHCCHHKLENITHDQLISTESLIPTLTHVLEWNVQRDFFCSYSMFLM